MKEQIGRVVAAKATQALIAQMNSEIAEKTNKYHEDMAEAYSSKKPSSPPPGPSGLGPPPAKK